jgi:hypothetical protein
MIEKGALTEQVNKIEDLPKDKREELIVQVKTMLLKSNLSIQESLESTT